MFGSLLSLPAFLVSSQATGTVIKGYSGAKYVGRKTSFRTKPINETLNESLNRSQS